MEMMDEESRALVPLRAARTVVGRAQSPAVRAGTRALALLARNAGVRRAAVAGVAFGVGFQVSRVLRSGQLPQAASTAKDVYRALSQQDPVAEGRLAAGWVRESITVISTVYDFLDRGDR